MLNAAIDGQDWKTAALCILANPISTKLTTETTRPLAQIAFPADLQAPVPDQAKFIRGVVRLVDAMESRYAR